MNARTRPLPINTVVDTPAGPGLIAGTISSRHGSIQEWIVAFTPELTGEWVRRDPYYTGDFILAHYKPESVGIIRIRLTPNTGGGTRRIP